MYRTRDTNGNPTVSLTTTKIYDADGATVLTCPPRQLADGGAGTCALPSGTDANTTVDPTTNPVPATYPAYSTWTIYNYAGLPASTTTWRDSAGTAGTSTTSGSANRAMTAYDHDAQTVAVRDANGHLSAVSVDALDRAEATTTPRSSTGTFPTYTPSSTTTARTLYTPSGDTLASIQPGTSTDNANSATRITGYAYDSAHRLIDSVNALQVSATDPASNPSSVSTAISTAVPNAANGTNLRTRTLYDADGDAIGQYSPRAFTDSASLTTPNPDYLSLASYDADNRLVAVATPRYDSNTGASNDPNLTDPNSDTQQGTQCPVNPTLPSADASTSYTNTTINPANPNSTPAGQPTYAVQACVTRYGYDTVGQVASELLPTSANGINTARQLGMTYSTDGLLTSVTGPNPGYDPRATAPANTDYTSHHSETASITLDSYAYDGAGRRIETTPAVGGSACTYFNEDGTVAASTPATTTGCTGQSGEAHLTTYGYDANGGKTTTAQTVTIPKTISNTLTNTAVTVTAYQAYTTDELVCATRTPGSSDPANAPSTAPSGCAPATSNYWNETDTSYDHDGNPTTVLTPDAVAGDSANSNKTPTLNSYTDDNLLAQTEQPVIANGTQPNAWRRTQYTYDNASRRSATTTDLIDISTGIGVSSDPDQPNNTADTASTTCQTYYPDDLGKTSYGRTTLGTDCATAHLPTEKTTTSYDAAGDPTSITYTRPDATTTTTTSTYYADGMPRTTVEAGHTTKVSYDGLGQPTARTESTSGGDVTSSWTANDADATLSMSAPNGTTSWEHDDAGRPTTQAAPSGIQDTWAFAATDTTSNPVDSLTSITTKNGSTQLAKFGYTYDEAYRVSSQAYTPPSGTATSYTYAYYPSGTLRSFTNGTLASTTSTWDHDGNRLSYTQPDATAHTYTYRADDSIATDAVTSGSNTAPVTSLYDALGRLTDDGCSQYNYNGNDMLTGRLASGRATTSGTCGATSPGTATYSYDALGRQLQIVATPSGGSATTTALTYDGLGDQVDTEASTGAITGTNTYTLDRAGNPTAISHTGGSSYTQDLSPDGTGNVGTVSDSSGNAVCAYRYDPYGNADGNSSGALTNACTASTTANDLEYRTSRVDATAGTYQHGARTYDPGKGSWLTPDTPNAASQAAPPSSGADPLTSNTYAYVNGDPLNLSDCSGHYANPNDTGPDGGTFYSYASKQAAYDRGHAADQANMRHAQGVVNTECRHIADVCTGQSYYNELADHLNTNNRLQVSHDLRSNYLHVRLQIITDYNNAQNALDAKVIAASKKSVLNQVWGNAENLPSGIAQGFNQLAKGVVNLPGVVIDGYRDIYTLTTGGDAPAHTYNVNWGDVPLVNNSVQGKQAYHIMSGTIQVAAAVYGGVRGAQALMKFARNLGADSSAATAGTSTASLPDASPAPADLADSTAYRGASQMAPGGQAGPSVSVSQVRMAVGRAGMSVSRFDIEHTPEILDGAGNAVYGSSSTVGGTVELGSRGLPLIRISDLGLSDMDTAVATVFHEAYHLDSFATFGTLGTEDAAESFALRMLGRFQARSGG